MIDLLANGVKECGLEPPMEAIDRLLTHIQLVHKWNQKMNLTGAASELEILQDHTLDSVFAASAAETYVKGGKAVDLGSGAGFPGIPTAILFPETELLLLEPSGKKVAFLEKSAFELGLENVEVVCMRLEEFSAMNENPHQFDKIFCRAVSIQDQSVGWISALLRDGGLFIWQVSPTQAVKSGGLGLDLAETAQSPFSINRMVQVFRKRE